MDEDSLQLAMEESIQKRYEYQMMKENLMEQSIKLHKLFRPVAEEGCTAEVRQLLVSYQELTQKVVAVIHEKEDDILEGCHR